MLRLLFNIIFGLNKSIKDDFFFKWFEPSVSFSSSSSFGTGDFLFIDALFWIFFRASSNLPFAISHRVDSGTRKYKPNNRKEFFRRPRIVSASSLNLQKEEEGERSLVFWFSAAGCWLFFEHFGIVLILLESFKIFGIFWNFWILFEALGFFLILFESFGMFWIL